MQGYIKLHRKLLDNCIMQKSDYLALWVTLLLMANHEETEFIWNNKKQILKAGQLLTGRKSLANQTKIKESQIYKILKYFENEQQIEQQTTNQFTIISIKNWDSYQKSNSRVTAKKQPSNTYKNVNKNDNKKIVSKDTSKNAEIKNRNLELINYFKETIGTNLEGSGETNWRYCTHLTNRLIKQFPNNDPLKMVKSIIDIAVKDDFHSKNANSFKYLFNNYLKIIRNYQSKKQSVAII